MSPIDSFVIGNVVCYLSLVILYLYVAVSNELYTAS
jgi:hypothetical protein